MELVTHLLTSFMKDQYYRMEDEGAARLLGLLDSVEPAYDKFDDHRLTKYRGDG
jgi:hypothetical protein